MLILKIEKIEELLSAIQSIGAATGCNQRAEQLINNLNKQLNDLRMKIGSAKKVKVLWVVQTDPLRIAGKDVFINQMIELAGGENAIGPTHAKYPQIGTEELLFCRAEVIVQSAMSGGDISQQQKAAEEFWSKYKNLPAVKNNRIYVLCADTTLRLGPRLCQGIEMLAGCLHPEIFTVTDVSSQQAK